MTKTPEQMAEEYAESVRIYDYHTLDGVDKSLLRKGFLAGYEAAKDEILSKGMQGYITEIRNDAWCTAMQLGQQSQWISVKERLPEEGQMCVVQSNWHGVLLSERIEDRWLLKEDDGHYERPTHWVTHWVPLPAPPKEEK